MGGGQAVAVSKLWVRPLGSTAPPGALRAQRAVVASSPDAAAGRCCRPATVQCAQFAGAHRAFDRLEGTNRTNAVRAARFDQRGARRPAEPACTQCPRRIATGQGGKWRVPPCARTRRCNARHAAAARTLAAASVRALLHAAAEWVRHTRDGVIPLYALSALSTLEQLRDLLPGL